MDFDFFVWGKNIETWRVEMICLKLFLNYKESRIKLKVFFFKVFFYGLFVFVRLVMDGKFYWEDKKDRKKGKDN